jgi:hypothetical protein
VLPGAGGLDQGVEGQHLRLCGDLPDASDPVLSDASDFPGQVGDGLRLVVRLLPGFGLGRERNQCWCRHGDNPVCVQSVLSATGLT